MTLADYLVTRTVELVVHTDDLNRAAGADIPLDRQALAACTRLLRRARREGARRVDGGADPAVRRRAVRGGPPAHPGHTAERRGCC